MIVTLFHVYLVVHCLMHPIINNTVDNNDSNYDDDNGKNIFVMKLDLS